jgi:hypothetical protein
VSVIRREMRVVISMTGTVYPFERPLYTGQEEERDPTEAASETILFIAVSPTHKFL